MNFKLYICTVGFSLLLHGVTNGQESCRVFTDCAACISSTLACGWCNYRGYITSNDTLRPCDTPDALSKSGCPSDKLVNPKSTDPLTNGSTPQLNPTKYVMSLRTQTQKSLPIRVTPQADFPLDLYMLMDISNTMSPFLSLAQGAADQLLQTVNALTSDSRLGFGTFVEKRIQPFVDTDIHMADSFHNVQPLTTNLSQFQTNIDQVTTSNNLDTPEGALDALVQAMVCGDGIEWRGKFDALRMVLLMTDADFHYALDGKLAGIISANDLQCHLSGGVEDSRSTTQLSPSYSQVVRTVLEENIVVIFSVAAEVRDLYTEVSNLIYGSNTSSPAALLSSQLSDLIQLINTAYLESSTTVTPVLISRDSHIYSALSLASCDQVQGLVCTNVSYNTSAEYTVEVSLDEHVCTLPVDERVQRVTYAFVGFGQVTIEVSPICSCDCEAQAELNSMECMNQGSLICSVCSCNDGFQGPTCNCTSSQSTGCVNPISPDGEVCTGRGRCNCGNCECSSQLFSGDFCECDNTRCPFFMGSPCGGSLRGTCNCNGTCGCTPDYEHGEFNPVRRCECPKPNSEEARMNCIAMTGESDCSGHGVCECGRCICKRGPDGSLESPLFEGRFCEICSICQSACDTIEACVQCLLTGHPACDMCREMACGANTTCQQDYLNPTLERGSNASLFSALRDNPLNRVCAVMLAECIWDVVLPANLTGMESGINLFASLRVCPAFIEWWYYLVAAIGVTVTVGVVALIVIRLIYRYIEHRQFQRWDKEVQSVPFQMGKSPLYVSPDQEFRNPAYVQKKEGEPSAIKKPIYQKKTHEPLLEKTMEF